MKNLIFISAFVFIVSCSQKTTTVDIIPRPMATKIERGTFTISEKTAVVCNTDEEKKSGLFLIEALKKFNNVVLSEKESTSDAIILTLTDTMKYLGNEGYKMTVTGDKITISAGTGAGLFYGVQSLIQLCRTNNNIKISALTIEDKPRFAWRGMHLDESRHFQGKEAVKKYIDMLAMLKMNIFHWHLTDDQGWRIEIKKYPKLTSIGAWREDRNDERWELSDEQRRPLKEKRPPYGGYYTQEEIKEIVKYAADRYITIVPEIEMPGHSQAALVAYPEVSCFGRANHVPVGLYTAEDWNFSDPFCVGNEKTFEFLENILIEVMDLFPSVYIHVGGDECRKVRWSECPKCKARMKKEGMKEVEELQSYLIKRVEKFLNSKERKLIGWQEILEGGLSPQATVMAWRGRDALHACIESAKQGHDVIMASSEYVYFGGDHLALSKVYSFEPVPQELSAEDQKYIIGVNGCAWGEQTLNPKDLEFQVMPHLCALAEVGWTAKEQKNEKCFLARMEQMYPRLNILDINYALPKPSGLKNKIVFTDKAVVEITTPDSLLVIRYTTDGHEPAANSLEYKGPITVEQTTTITAALFDKFGHHGKTISGICEKQELRKAEKIKNVSKGLKYAWFNTRFRSAEELDAAKPNSTGVIDTIGIVNKNGKGDGGTMFTGYIEVPENGVYSFYLTSDDGSLLWIGNNLVTNNDGYTGSKDKKGNFIFKSGQAALEKGLHAIKLNYFDWGAGEALKLFIEGPGIEKQEVTSNMLFH